jgi:hypothetical protein
MIKLERQTVNRADFCRITGIGRERAQALIAAGKIPNVGTKRRPLIPIGAIQKILEEGIK